MHRKSTVRTEGGKLDFIYTYKFCYLLREPLWPNGQAIGNTSSKKVQVLEPLPAMTRPRDEDGTKLVINTQCYELDVGTFQEFEGRKRHMGINVKLKRDSFLIGDRYRFHN